MKPEWQTKREKVIEQIIRVLVDNQCSVGEAISVLDNAKTAVQVYANRQPVIAVTGLDLMRDVY